MGEPGAELSAAELLRIVAHADPQELCAWAEANDLPASICAALRGGSATTLHEAAQYRGAVVFAQAEIVRLALRQLGRATGESASRGQREADTGSAVIPDAVYARSIALAVVLAALALLL